MMKKMINQKNLDDIESYLLKFLTYKQLPKDHIELSIIIFVGSMGSGKSTAINYILYLLEEIYSEKASFFKTNDLVYAIKNLEYNFVNCIVIDDAIAKSFDSRRSMSNENIIMSQSLSIARHIANEKAKKGILFLIFSVQDEKRIDAFIRRNADMIIYKTYYKTLDKVLDKDNLAYVKNFTRLSMIEHNFRQRAYALAIDRVNRVYKFYFPKVREIKLTEILENEDSLSEKKGFLKERLDDVVIYLDKLINKRSYQDLEFKYEISHSTLFRRIKQIENLFKE